MPPTRLVDRSDEATLDARRVLDDGAAARVYPAAVAEVGSSSEVHWRHAVGRLTYDEDSPATTTDTIFDLASLTKVIATATLAMRLVDRGVLELDAPIAQDVPGWGDGVRRTVAVRDLLEHSSGLPAWAPLHETVSGREAFVSAIAAIPLEYEPRARSVYSDLGFILLGFILESRASEPLDRQFGELMRQVGLGDWPELRYLPPASWRPRTAPTRVDAKRDRLLIGEVDDANAAAMGGVAGHAGLFGTAGAVGAFARLFLSEYLADHDGPGRLARRETIRRFLTRSPVTGSSRALGWDTMLPTSSCGTRMSASAFGHTGFTGTSLWIDPARDLYAVLLTNRVYPDGGPQDGIRRIRRTFHDALIRERDQ